MPDSWFSEEKMHKIFIRDVYAMMSRDQDGRHAHYMVKHFKIFFSGTGLPISKELGMKHRLL